MEQRILEMLNEIRPEFDFTSSEDFVEDGFLDSFDVVTLVSMLESEYNIIIDGLDVLPDYFCTVQSIVELVKKSS